MTIWPLHRRLDAIYTLNRQKLRRIRRREGRYLLRTNFTENDPALASVTLAWR
jgi:hypothetical protein